MAKSRKSTGSGVVETIQGQADAAANAAIRSTIPNPVVIDIAWEDIRPDRTFNVREESSYSKASNMDLYTSLKGAGFDRSKPLMAVSRQLDGSNLLLRGYVRHAMMTLIRDEIRDENSKAENETDRKPIPFETVPVAVYGSEGELLTREQETAIMADHTGSRPLNNYERCTMIGKAWEAAQKSGRKLSDKTLAANLGVSEPTAQRDRYVYNMPTVYENLRKSVHDEPGVVKYNQDDLHDLWKAYVADKAVHGKDRVEGVNFRKAWEAIKSKATLIADGSKPKLKTATEIAVALKGLEGYDDTPATRLIRDAVKWFVGDPEASCGAMLEGINQEWLAKDTRIAELESRVTDLTVALAEVSTERDTLKAEINGLLSEVKESGSQA